MLGSKRNGPRSILGPPGKCATKRRAVAVVTGTLFWDSWNFTGIVLPPLNDLTVLGSMGGPKANVKQHRLIKRPFETTVKDAPAARSATVCGIPRQFEKTSRGLVLA